MEILLYIGGYFAIGAVILAVCNYRAAKSGSIKKLSDDEKGCFGIICVVAWPIILPIMLFGVIYNSTIWILSLIGGKVE